MTMDSGQLGPGTKMPSMKRECCRRSTGNMVFRCDQSIGSSWVGHVHFTFKHSVGEWLNVSFNCLLVDRNRVSHPEFKGCRAHGGVASWSTQPLECIKPAVPSPLAFLFPAGRSTNILQPFRVSIWVLGSWHSDGQYLSQADVSLSDLFTYFEPRK